MAPPGTLLVEDDDLRAVTAEFLRDMDSTVYEAPDGKPALERLRTHPEGLVVLLDLMMPEMDGYAVLEAVAAESPLATRRAYILVSATSRIFPLTLAATLKQLNVTSVPKPFDLDELLAAVQKAASTLH